MLDRKAAIDQCFLDCRCMLLELAAALDRHDRAAPPVGLPVAPDEQLALLQQLIRVLAQSGERPDRVARMLQLMSHPVD